MKQYKKGFVLLLICILVLSGCSADPYPEMTDAEYAVVVRYAASLLTRYNKGTADKLAYLDAEYTPDYLAAEAQSAFDPEAPQPETDTSPVTDPVTTEPATPETNAVPESDPQEQTDGGNSDTQEQTPDAQGGADTADDEPEDTGSYAPVANYTGIGESGLQTLANNVRVEYTGYSVKSVYPDSRSQGAVAAAQGDKLLVVDFSVQNITDVPVSFNTASKNPQFKLSINNNVQGFTMVTMIPNDLSGMDRELAPGERTDAVLLMEVPESLAKSVDTLDLIIKIRGEDEQTVKLE